VLDGYLIRHPDDQDMLFAAIVSQYEAVRGGQNLSNIDRTRFRGMRHERQIGRSWTSTLKR
jgi:hypothetical protein